MLSTVLQLEVVTNVTDSLRFIAFKCVCACVRVRVCVCVHIEGVSRLVDITAGGDFLGLCDQKSSYKHVSDFGRLRSYDRLKLRIEGNDY